MPKIPVPINVGDRFGRLTVTRPIGKARNGERVFECLCDCGNSKDVRAGNLLCGNTKSCRCLHNELLSKMARTHGLRDTPEYDAWCNMRRRCFDPANQDYCYYGERGIRVCDAWTASFLEFYNHIGPRPSPGHSVDRIDTDGNYEPGNVRWATAREQRMNQRRAKGGINGDNPDPR